MAEQRSRKWLFAVFALACGSGQQAEPKQLSSKAAAALDDSMRVLVNAYEAGGLKLEVAAQHLADLVEPTGGFAWQPGASMRANQLFEATGRELRRRDAIQYGIPDSLR
jgi:hypothetical protein